MWCKVIELAVYNVSEALVVGGLLVAVVLALFLMNFRTTCITLLAIPLSRRLRENRRQGAPRPTAVHIFAASQRLEIQARRASE